MATSLPCTLAVLCATLAVPALSPAAPLQDYDSLIREARNGDYPPALDMLRQRLQAFPHDRKFLSDYLVISGWEQGKDAQTTQAYVAAGSPGDLAAAPLASVARAYRNQQQWNPALALYAQGRQRFPMDLDFLVGQIMTLADAGRIGEATTLGQQTIERYPHSADARLALGYVYQRARAPYAALEQVSAAQDLTPHSRYVEREYIQALQRANLPRAALRRVQAQPGILTAAQERSLQGDMAAQLTRMASTPAREDAAEFQIADEALARYDQLIPQWSAQGDAAHQDLLRARADRLQALHARGRTQDIITEYKAMQARGDAVPDYVLGDVAAAYLDQRQPEEAEPLFRKALASPREAHDPGVRLANQTGLFYALLESGHIEEANREMDAAVAEQPIWLNEKGDPVRQPNNRRMSAELTRAMGYLYEDHTREAQKRLDHLANEAPDNTAMRTARAQVYLARNLPRAAERELKIAETQSPRSIDVEVHQAETAMALQEWEQARLLRDDVIAREPNDRAVQRLDREWQVHNMSELQVTVNRGLSTDSPVLGSHDWTIDSVLYSPPINDNWRAFAGVGFSMGEFDKGNGYDRRARAGVEWRSRDLTIQGQAIAHNFGYGVHTGAALSAALDFNNHWQAGVGVSLLSDATPLRALKNDITANSLSTYLRWRADDRQEWRLSFTPSRFSDGNNRMELGLDGRVRLYTAPRFKVDGLLSLSASHNTRDDAPYFNPRSDLTVVPALQLTHTLYQRYDTQWDQRFLIGAGTYSQQNYGTAGLFTVGYGQRFRYNKVLDVGFMVSATSRPYDGQRERDYAITVDMTYRF
ncbi:Poly-beta-1,6-N-acetyl-D-glucosamine export protein [Castellaniella defragrans]